MTPEAVLERLTGDRTALLRRQAEVDRVVSASSAGHLVHELNVRADDEGGRPWRVDPIPFVLDGPTFDRLAAGVVERVRVLEQILADLYGRRTLVSTGVVPGEALSSSLRYRTGSVGIAPPRRWLTACAVDVVALADGTWRVVADRTDSPTGIGYALLDRAAMLPVAEEVEGTIAPLTGVIGELRRALAANTTVPSPRIVLLSGGSEHAGYVEDSQLARRLGFTLVERPDLVVRQRRVWLRSLGGLDPVDVVYRRLEDDATDPIEIAAPGGTGVPGLLSAVADGGVALANAHGSGVLEDSDLARFWPAAAEALTGAALRLPQLADGANHNRLATFPAFQAGSGLGGAQDFVGETAVAVRLHAIAGPDGVHVVPGGNGRVLALGDDPRRPTARTIKDVWVLDPARALPPVVTPLPQVDLAASVPTRAADALFWAGRAAERAEAIARTIHVIAVRRSQDPVLVILDGGAWARRMAATLRAVRDADEVEEDTRGAIVELDAETVAATSALAGRLRAFVTAAATVGEFLPGRAAGVLTTVAHHVDGLADGRATVAALDDVLAALAAFAGMWNESTVRGPAWRFGDIGFRVERALVLVGLVAVLADGSDTEVEVLLAANESLVAYRRQYRSDVALAATLDLLLRDRDNPRGYLSCLDRLADDVADVGWAEGSTAVAAMAAMVPALTPDDHVDPARRLTALPTIAAALRRFAGDVVTTWFSTPVKPMLIRAGRAAYR